MIVLHFYEVPAIDVTAQIGINRNRVGLYGFVFVWRKIGQK
jgi:hypothetical protein